MEITRYPNGHLGLEGFNTVGAIHVSRQAIWEHLSSREFAATRLVEPRSDEAVSHSQDAPDGEIAFSNLVLFYRMLHHFMPLYLYRTDKKGMFQFWSCMEKAWPFPTTNSVGATTPRHMASFWSKARSAHVSTKRFKTNPVTTVLTSLVDDWGNCVREGLMAKSWTEDNFNGERYAEECRSLLYHWTGILQISQIYPPWSQAWERHMRTVINDVNGRRHQSHDQALESSCQKSNRPPWASPQECEAPDGPSLSIKGCAIRDGPPSFRDGVQDHSPEPPSSPPLTTRVAPGAHFQNRQEDSRYGCPLANKLSRRELFPARRGPDADPVPRTAARLNGSSSANGWAKLESDGECDMDIDDPNEPDTRLPKAPVARKRRLSATAESSEPKRHHVAALLTPHSDGNTASLDGRGSNEKMSANLPSKPPVMADKSDVSLEIPRDVVTKLEASTKELGVCVDMARTINQETDKKPWAAHGEAAQGVAVGANVLDQLKGQFDVIAQQIQSLDAKSQTQTDVTSSLQTELKRLEQRLGKMENACADLSTRSNAQGSRMDTQISDLGKKLSAGDRRDIDMFGRLEGVVNVQRKAIQGLQNAHGSIESRLADLKSFANGREHGKLDTRLSALESASRRDTELEEALKHVQGYIDAQERMQQAQQKHAVARDARVSEIEGQNAGMSAKIGGLEAAQSAAVITWESRMAEMVDQLQQNFQQQLSQQLDQQATCMHQAFEERLAAMQQQLESGKKNATTVLDDVAHSEINALRRATEGQKKTMDELKLEVREHRLYIRNQAQVSRDTAKAPEHATAAPVNSLQEQLTELRKLVGSQALTPGTPQTVDVATFAAMDRASAKSSESPTLTNSRLMSMMGGRSRAEKDRIMGALADMRKDSNDTVTMSRDMVDMIQSWMMRA